MTKRDLPAAYLRLPESFRQAIRAKVLEEIPEGEREEGMSEYMVDLMRHYSTNGLEEIRVMVEEDPRRYRGSTKGR